MPASSLAHARATEALYLQHHSWLVARLKRKLGCAWDAADLAQNTFVRVLAANTDRLGEVAEPRAYLTTIAQRLLSNHLRRQQIERAYLEALAGLPEPAVMRGGSSRRLTGAELAKSQATKPVSSSQKAQRRMVVPCMW